MSKNKVNTSRKKLISQLLSHHLLNKKNNNFIKIKREGIVLEKTTNEFENDSVLNPAVIAQGKILHMFYRAVKVHNKSSIGYCRLKGPTKVVERNTEPLLSPQFNYECNGMEDPRIVQIEELYYMTYTAYDGNNAMGALATSKDLVNWQRRGIITPRISFENFRKISFESGCLTNKYFRFESNLENETMNGKKLFVTDKDLVLFPRKINGKFYILHRIKPDIQLIVVEDFSELDDKFWHDYFLNFSSHIIFKSKYQHESSYLGAGCPPIETSKGWLMIYHSVCDTVEGFIYSASAALLDLNNPAIEIARLPYPLFSPETEYELTGVVNRVCFPTGTAQFGDRLYIYYGAADNCIACVSVNLQELITELLIYKK